jgi:ribosomal protein S18 acetylase RimI-like enzyme
MPAIRRGAIGDLAAIAQIQAASPEAAHWDPVEYLSYDLLVAVCENNVTGFLVTRHLGVPEEGNRECEILNLAVAPTLRRRGIARRLFETRFAGYLGAIYLEVRESNQEARNFYESLGFKEVSRRPEYYLSPTEAAIVMKFHSC